MTNNKILMQLMTLILLSVLFGCESKSVEDPVDNPYTLNSDVNLNYENLAVYSVLENIVTDAPSFNIKTFLYSFTIQKITNSSSGKLDNISAFSIDSETGVITINNNNGILKAGTKYTFDIGINNVNGTILEEEAFTLSINDIPLDISASTASVDLGFLDEGEVATVAYIDTSTSEDIIEASSVSYELSNPPTGFTINSDTGVISRSTEASTGTYKLSVNISTNVGAVLFEEVLTINIGESPTLAYTKQDNSAALSNVTLSPWTPYTTATPQLVGMDANGGYEIIVPPSLSSDSFLIDADGAISVFANQNLPLGTYNIGVSVTNTNGVSVPFEDIFTLTVETRWETTPIFSEDFETASNNPVNELNSSLSTYRLNGSQIDFIAANLMVGARNLQATRIQENRSPDGQFNTVVDASLVLTLPMQPEWRNMRVRFNEMFGFGTNRLDWYERTLSVGHDISDLETGNYNDSNWNVIMAPDNTEWSRNSLWTPNVNDDLMNNVGNKVFDLTAGEPNVFINWRIYKTGTATGGAIFLIDNINVEVSAAFDAEEN